MITKYAAAINDQGRFANTFVGHFSLNSDLNAHIYKGRIATSMSELAEIVNESLVALVEFADPNLTLRIIPAEIPSQAQAEPPPADDDDSPPTPESIKTSLVQANDELRSVIEKRPTGPTLKLIGQED